MIDALHEHLDNHDSVWYLFGSSDWTRPRSHEKRCATLHAPRMRLDDANAPDENHTENIFSETWHRYRLQRIIT
jgi:hypothetical protein